MEITSPAFEQNESIPEKYTCDGQDISPKLTFSGVPDKAESLALIFDDPDAPMGLWVHWVLFNMPSDTEALPEGTTAADLPRGTVQGQNSWDKLGYGGPCPPDKEHRYFFKLYALDTRLDIKEGATKEELEQAMKGHILDQAELMGRYDRKR